MCSQHVPSLSARNQDECGQRIGGCDEIATGAECTHATCSASSSMHGLISLAQDTGNWYLQNPRHHAMYSSTATRFADTASRCMRYANQGLQSRLAVRSYQFHSWHSTNVTPSGSRTKQRDLSRTRSRNKAGCKKMFVCHKRTRHSTSTPPTTGEHVQRVSRL